jgi:hypothetical protein
MASVGEKYCYIILILTFIRYIIYVSLVCDNFKRMNSNVSILLNAIDDVRHDEHVMDFTDTCAVIKRVHSSHKKSRCSNEYATKRYELHLRIIDSVQFAHMC